MSNSMIVKLSGKNGMFHVENSVTFYRKHETTTSMKENITTIMKELRKMAKNGEVTVNILSMDSDYQQKNVHRFFTRSSWDGFTVDSRKFNGYDYSDSNILHFVDDKNRFAYAKQLLVEYASSIMGTLPDDECLYMQELENERSKKEIM